MMKIFTLGGRYELSQKAFTLVELLVVITVIGILAGVTVSVLSSAGPTAKVRDTKRKADLKEIQTALELYYNDNNSYPAASSWGTVDSKLSSLAPNYINSLPPDPSGNTGSNICSAATRRYFYKRIDSKNYRLAAILEKDKPKETQNKCLKSETECAVFLEACYLLKN